VVRWAKSSWTCDGIQEKISTVALRANAKIAAGRRLSNALNVASGTQVRVYRRVMTTQEKPEDWVPQACTLPTIERPLRLAEFDSLFATALRAQQRVAPTRLRWTLDPAAEDPARDLTARETGCCSFFTFTFALSAEVLHVDVEVPASHVDVLTALADRAAATAGMPA
jgi:hypothetical protein